MDLIRLGNKSINTTEAKWLLHPDPENELPKTEICTVFFMKETVVQ